MMHLTVLLPTLILIDAEAETIAAEADNGSFVMFPNHVDFLTTITPGILSYKNEEGEHFVAVDEGILIKNQQEVNVVIYGGVCDDDLSRLADTVESEYRTLDERDKQARTAATKLEAGFFRGMLQQGGQSRETG